MKDVSSYGVESNGSTTGDVSSIRLTHLIIFSGRSDSMKKIVGVISVAETDSIAFHKIMSMRIAELQNDGQEVEVQYQMATFPNGQMVQSALVLGRK
jgi:hypothetical protein